MADACVPRLKTVSCSHCCQHCQKICLVIIYISQFLVSGVLMSIKHDSKRSRSSDYTVPLSIHLTYSRSGSVSNRKDLHLTSPLSFYTYHEFITRFKLCLDFLADFAVGDTQVLPDVTVVTHQGHVVFIDVNQLGR